jgi:hypothetical protein
MCAVRAASNFEKDFIVLDRERKCRGAPTLNSIHYNGLHLSFSQW